MTNARMMLTKRFFIFSSYLNGGSFRRFFLFIYTCMIQNVSSHKCHSAKHRVFAAENCMRARFYSSKDQAISSSMAWTVSGQLYWFI